MKLNEISSYIHLKDIKSIENWCLSNQLDIHIQRKRKYVYEHELMDILEYNYVSDTMKNHPEDFIIRCSNYVSYSTLLKFSGYTASNLIVTTNSYSHFPQQIQDLLKTI